MGFLFYKINFYQIWKLMEMVETIVKHGGYFLGEGLNPHLGKKP